MREKIIAIAEQLNISRDMARLWRNRWLALAQKEVAVMERLQDAERCGGPTSFRANSPTVCDGCEKPEGLWTTYQPLDPRELADEMSRALWQRFLPVMLDDCWRRQI